MTQLSNSGLLDGDVARNMNQTRPNPNRAERLQRTTQFAENPEQVMEESAVEQTHNFNYSEPKPEVADEKPSSLNIDKYSTPYAETQVAKKVDDDKILGMNKWLVIGIGVTIVAIGGYFVYTKYIKKSNIPASSGGSIAATPAAPAPAAPVVK